MKKLQVIRDLLYKIIEDIDAGNSNISDDQYDSIIEQINFLSNSNTDAISEPVHAPVPGRGIPTKSTTPRCK